MAGRARIYLLSRVGGVKQKLKSNDAQFRIQRKPSTQSESDRRQNTFHLVGLENRGAIVLQQKVTVISFGAGSAYLALPDRMETCSGRTFYLHRQLAALVTMCV